GAALLGMRRCPDMATMTFDDSARDRKRETEAAAPIVECGAGRIVCSLYAALSSDDKHGRVRIAWFVLEPPVDHDRAGRWPFAKNGPENRVEGTSKASGVTDERRAPNLAAYLQSHLALRRLMHTVGHILHK